MAFIKKEDPVVLNIILTSKGRERLSTGNLTFKYFTVGDSEIDYNFIREINSDLTVDYNPFDSNILRPKDKNPRIISYIPKVFTGDSYNEITTISPMPFDVVNTVNPLGFFTNSGNTYITQATHIKQPDVMVYMSGMTGGTILNLRKAPTYGTSVLEPQIGDYLYIKWTFSGNTTGFTVNRNLPIPNLFYKISDVAGILANDSMWVEVDRVLPNLMGYSITGISGAMIFYSGITDTHQFSTDYLSESVLDFIENYQCGIANFPFWNMSLVFTEEIAGIQDEDRKFSQFKTRGYGGFVSYIQNQAPYYKKLGIIHYTNNSPTNTYGEELYLKTPVLDIPTIMWHKSSGTTMGIVLVPTGNSRLLSGGTTGSTLNIEYYDLADKSSGYVVGKMFNGLKLFVIEDQELLFAMSYKSNRSWTLPNYLLGTAGSNPCPPTIAPPTTPTLNKITKLNCDEFNLNWSESTSGNPPVRYILYRWDNIDITPIILINDLQITEYTDSNLIEGRTYYYKVISYDENSLFSEYSNSQHDSVSCGEEQPTLPIMNTITTINDNMLHVSWSASTSVYPPINYLLYRKTGSNGYDLISTQTLTYYNDSSLTGLISGNTYDYYVVARDNNNMESGNSNIVSHIAP